MTKFITCLLLLPALAWASDPNSPWTIDQAMENLVRGNERFVKGKPNVWDSGAAKRERLSSGQTPYACVITCSDSRVPPEQIFDSGLGELFVIRVAGNVTPVEVLASADYAVGHLHCPVVVVLGHTKCGAVSAALSESEFSEPLNSLVDEIRPHVESCQTKGYGSDDLFNGVIKENARAGASKLLSGSRTIEQAVSTGQCTVMSAVYDIESGEVSWQSQLGAVAIKRPTREAAPDEALEVKNPVRSSSYKSVAKTERESTSKSEEVSRKPSGSKARH